MAVAVSSNSSNEIDRNSQVVLRVKRKRADDPAEALVIQTKIPKHESDQASVLEFCGRLEPIGLDNSNILDVVQKFKGRSKLNPLSQLSITNTRDEKRSEKKNSSANERYKLLSTMRCLKWDNSNNANTDSSVHLCDAVIDQSMESDHQNCSSVGDITCNASVMAREKVRLSGDDDFVYDIYYSNRINVDTLDDVILCPYEAELVHDIIDSDEGRCTDDEEDSNDENNWRNDYPDEDDWKEDDDHDGFSDDSHDNTEYRQREGYYDEYSWDNTECEDYNDT